MIQKATASDFHKWWPQSVTIKSDFTRAARALCNESQNEILAFPRTMPFQGGHYLLWLLELWDVSRDWNQLEKSEVNNRARGNYFEWKIVTLNLIHVLWYDILGWKFIMIFNWEKKLFWTNKKFVSLFFPKISYQRTWTSLLFSK